MKDTPSLLGLLRNARPQHFLRRILSARNLFLGALLPAFASSKAATLTVTTAADEAHDGSETQDEPDGTGLSLREAIAMGEDGDVVTFDQGLTALILLTDNGHLVVEENLTIDGDLNNDGTPDFEIEGSGVERQFFIGSPNGGDRAEVRLEGLLLSNGGALGGDGDKNGGGGGLGAGGAIFVNHNGDLTLQDVIFSGSQAVGGDGAAGASGSYGGGGGGGMRGNGGAGDNNEDGEDRGGGGGGLLFVEAGSSTVLDDLTDIPGDSKGGGQALTPVSAGGQDYEVAILVAADGQALEIDSGGQLSIGGVSTGATLSTALRADYATAPNRIRPLVRVSQDGGLLYLDSLGVTANGEQVLVADDGQFVRDAAGRFVRLRVLTGGGTGGGDNGGVSTFVTGQRGNPGGDFGGGGGGTDDGQGFAGPDEFFWSNRIKGGGDGGAGGFGGGGGGGGNSDGKFSSGSGGHGGTGGFGGGGGGGGVYRLGGEAADADRWVGTPTLGASGGFGGGAGEPGGNLLDQALKGGGGGGGAALGGAIFVREGGTLALAEVSTAHTTLSTDASVTGGLGGTDAAGDGGSAGEVIFLQGSQTLQVDVSASVTRVISSTNPQGAIADESTLTGGPGKASLEKTGDGTLQVEGLALAGTLRVKGGSVAPSGRVGSLEVEAGGALAFELSSSLAPLQVTGHKSIAAETPAKATAGPNVLFPAIETALTEGDLFRFTYNGTPYEATLAPSDDKLLELQEDIDNATDDQGDALGSGKVVVRSIGRDIVLQVAGDLAEPATDTLVDGEYVDSDYINDVPTATQVGAEPGKTARLTFAAIGDLLDSGDTLVFTYNDTEYTEDLGTLPDTGDAAADLLTAIQTALDAALGSSLVTPSLEDNALVLAATTEDATLTNGSIRLRKNPDVSLAGTLQLTLADGYAPSPGTEFTLIENAADNVLAGTFAGAAEGSTINLSDTLGVQLTYAGGADSKNLVGTIVAPQADAIPPTASLSSAPDVTAASSAYLFSVTYADDMQLNTSSIDSNDITVTGPNSYEQTATFVSLNGNQAQYSIVPPSGTWDHTANGTYVISLNASQVTDASGNPVASGQLGTFEVNLPLPDTTPPQVLSILRHDPASSSFSPPGGDANQVVFEVTFSEEVTGVDVGDFRPSGTASAGAIISQVVQGASADVYLVTVSNITQAGTLGLQVIASTPDN